MVSAETPPAPVPTGNSDGDTGTGPRLRSRSKLGNSGILVVVFSQVRVPAAKFGLERLFTGTRHSCLFLNDADSGWYLGLEAEIDATVADAVTTSGARRLVFYGSSMGGYGALAAGLRNGWGDIHAFAVELRLGHPGSQSRNCGIPPDPVTDIAAGAPSGHQGAIHLYFGIQDAIDAAGAALAPQVLPQAHSHVLQSCHACHDHLYTLNLIRRIIGGFERDPARELASKSLLLDPRDYDLAGFAALAEALAGGTPVETDTVLALAGCRRHPGMLKLAAEAAAAHGDNEQATTLLAEADGLTEADPVLKTLPKRWRKQAAVRRCDLLLQNGEMTEARTCLESLLARFPADEHMRSLAESLGMPPPSS